MPKRLLERKLTIHFEPPSVLPVELLSVEKMWERGVPMAAMIKRLMPARTFRGVEPLSYVDIYSIAFNLRKDERIRDRKNPYRELTIDDFSKFFNVWKCGGTLEECLIAVDTKEKGSRNFCEAVFRSMSNRYRKERDIKNSDGVRVDLSTGNSPVPVMRGVGVTPDQARWHRQILDLGRRETIQGRQALVIYLDEIPLDWLPELYKQPGMALQLNPTIQSGEQFAAELEKRMSGEDALPRRTNYIPYIDEHMDPIDAEALDALDPDLAARKLADELNDGKIKVDGPADMSEDLEKHLNNPKRIWVDVEKKKKEEEEQKESQRKAELEKLIDDKLEDNELAFEQNVEQYADENFDLENLLDDDDPSK